MLFVGDSIIAWNRLSGRSIPDVARGELDRRVVSRAVPGARLSNPSKAAAALGFDIRRQVSGNGWEWIVAGGGGNDLSAEDGCGGTTAVLDELIGPDGRTGEIPAFVRRLRESTDRVLWLGYPPPPAAGGPFSRCERELVALDARLARMAAALPGVHFVTARQVVPAGDLAFYDADRLHPSPAASRAIGLLVARTIAEVEGRSR